MRKFGLLGTSALRSAVFIGFAMASVSPALAQDTQTPPGQDPRPTQPDDPAALGQNEVELESGKVADDGATGEEITVTGSRIRRPNLESAVPITSVGAVELTQRGDVSLGDALNELPSLRSTFSQANSTRFIGTSGLNLLDLRGLGTAAATSLRLLAATKSTSTPFRATSSNALTSSRAATRPSTAPTPSPAS
jgi:hypothetical protein